jgi:hypothetical protein
MAFVSTGLGARLNYRVVDGSCATPSAALKPARDVITTLAFQAGRAGFNHLGWTSTQDLKRIEEKELPLH